MVTRTLPDSSELSESVRYSTQAECDSDSDDGDLEVISTSDATSPTTSSEQDSPRHPTRGETQLGSWTALASGNTMRPSPSQLTLTPHLNGTSQGGDDHSTTSPSTDSQGGDSLVGSLARNSTPSPVPPKRRLHLLSGFLKSRDNHTASHPPLLRMQQRLLNSHFYSTIQGLVSLIVEKVSLRASCLDTRERKEALILIQKGLQNPLKLGICSATSSARSSQLPRFRNGFQDRPARRSPGYTSCPKNPDARVHARSTVRC